MAKQTIDIGTTPNKGDGDPLRTAFRKINENFDELYAGNFAAPDNTASHLVPSADATYDLGSFTHQWADLHVADFIYLNGARIEVTAGGALLVNGGAPAEVQDTVGSVFGDDSTLLVDGINNSINLDGTVAGDIIPNANEAYDLGSTTNRFRDLYLSGNTIDLGGTTLSIVGGNLQVGGTDIKDVVTAAGVDFADLTNKPTTLSAFGITDAYTQAEVDAAIAAQQHLPQGDLQGSVFADDSTLLVDGVAGKIVGAIDAAQQAIFKDSIVIQNGTDIITLGDAAGASFQLPNKGVSFLGGGVDGGSYNIAFTSNGNGSILVTEQFNILGGAAINIGTVDGLKINNTVTVDAAVTAPSFVGDLTGSVFADDSTLLVDGVNGSIPYSVISDVQVTESDLLVDWAGIVGSQIQTNGLPINTFTNGDLEVRGTLSAEDGSDLELSSTNDVNINTSIGDENHKFEFKGDGTFYMAKNSVSDTSYISTPRNDNTASLTLISATDLYIETNEGDGSTEVWTFGADGTTTFPGDAAINGKLLASAGDGSTNIGGSVERFGTAYVWGTNYNTTTYTGGSGTPVTLVPYIDDPETGNIVQNSLFVLNADDGSNNGWVLPDGVEGQIVHFVPGTGAATNQHLVTIQNWRRWDEGAGVAGEWRVEQNLDWIPFLFDNTPRYRSMATAVFVNGAWQTDTGWID